MKRESNIGFCAQLCHSFQPECGDVISSPLGKNDHMDLVICPYLVKKKKRADFNYCVCILCLSAGPSDCAVQELAHGRHRDEWGKNHGKLLFKIKL